MATTPNLPFIVAETVVRQDRQGRYCLNDLHKAAGGDPNHRPGEWLRNKQTQDLIAELKGEAASAPSETPGYESEDAIRQIWRIDEGSPGYEPDSPIAGIPAITGKPLVDPVSIGDPVNALQRQGTYVTKDLVYAYAMWISPAFHLLVIRTFDAYVSGRSRAVPEDVGAVSGLPTTKLINLQEQSWRLITRLRTETDPTIRAALHAQLTRVLGDLGQPPIELAPVAQPAQPTPEPPSVQAFWRAVATLEADGHTLNHHRHPAQWRAYSLRQVTSTAAKAGLHMPPTSELRAALKQCKTPLYSGAYVINSGITGKATWCWVFYTAPAQA